MRRIALLTISILSVLLSNVIIAVPAQTNHTLEWGVEVGDEITYVLEKKHLDPSLSSQMQNYSLFLGNVEEGQNVSARVDYLEPIPDLIIESRDMPSANCSLFRSNDSVVIADSFPMIVVPSGDWDFTNEITNLTWSESATVVDTPDEWGTSMSNTMLFGIFLVSFDLDIRYFKDNGTLSLLSIKVDVAGTDFVNIRLVVYRAESLTTIIDDDDFPILQLAIYVGIATVVIIVIALVIRHKTRTSKTQDL